VEKRTSLLGSPRSNDLRHAHHLKLFTASFNYIINDAAGKIVYEKYLPEKN
jgi:hypothetical protein